MPPITCQYGPGVNPDVSNPWLELYDSGILIEYGLVVGGISMVDK